MFNSRSLMTALTCLALACGSVTALADPGNGNGPGNGFDKGSPQGQQGQKPQDMHQGKPGGNQQQGMPQGKPGGNQSQGKHPEGKAHNKGPSVNRQHALGIVGQHRDYWSPGPALPPGVQKNLARGKPLPPGIGKKLDGRLAKQLPHYEGYEWRQAGTDLILVSLASGIIYEVLNGAFH